MTVMVFMNNSPDYVLTAYQILLTNSGCHLRLLIIRETDSLKILLLPQATISTVLPHTCWTMHHRWVELE
jgi:hypothetical protein